MVRTFETHKIRKYQELTGTGWTFTPFDGDKKGPKLCGSDSKLLGKLS